ncbi:unnamed protein product [Polarella glacialis]|uniref:Uncharacterized protein n=1 Tax=Polarella glacialis TaxID=89957 RepID=A0A813KW69_POLGL|nr:unnamed protein product [Polarella glacialis]
MPCPTTHRFGLAGVAGKNLQATLEGVLVWPKSARDGKRTKQTKTENNLSGDSQATQMGKQQNHIVGDRAHANYGSFIGVGWWAPEAPEKPTIAQDLLELM